MKRVALVIHAISPGGAERVMATIANHWAAEGREVTLLTLDDGSSPPFYPLDQRVRHRPLALAASSAGPWEKVCNNLRRVRGLRSALTEAAPEVVISFMESVNVLTLFATGGTGLPVVVSERIDPRFHPVGRAWQLLRWVSYRRASRVVVQSAAAMSHFPAAVKRRCVVIPNPVIDLNEPAGDNAAPSEPREPGLRTIIAMGRLEVQKGFDLLIQAFSGVAARHPRWCLKIFGEGSLRDTLQDAIVERGLEGRVMLCGVTPCPAEVFRRADLFVLSSRYEGFPNVLCEAMACGLPVIAYDCPSGPGEIIRDEVDGLLVPPDNVAELEQAMGRLMASDAERARLAGRAPEVRERFAVQKIMNQWVSLLNQVIRSNKAVNRG